MNYFCVFFFLCGVLAIGLAWPFSLTVVVALLGRPVKFGAVAVIFILNAFLVGSACKAFVTLGVSASLKLGSVPGLMVRRGALTLTVLPCPSDTVAAAVTRAARLAETCRITAFDLTVGTTPSFTTAERFRFRLDHSSDPGRDPWTLLSVYCAG